MVFSPRNSPRQSAIAKGFDEANSVLTVIISAKILPQLLFRIKICIQFTVLILISWQNYRLQKIDITQCGWVPLIWKIKKMKWEEKRTDYRIFTKVHVLFSPGNELQSIWLYFETFRCFTKCSSHHKWNDGWLLLLNMVYTSSLTSWWTT